MSKNLGIFSLEGKVIIVTGGTQRYGYHFCEALVEAGGTIILTSRDKKRAEETARRLDEERHKVFGYRLELAEDGSIDEFVNVMVKKHKKIDAGKKQ